MCICLWITAERWTFVKTGGSRWLIQYLKGQIQAIRWHTNKVRAATYTGINKSTDAIKQVYWKRTLLMVKRFWYTSRASVWGTIRRVATNVLNGGSLVGARIPNVQRPSDEESQAGGRTRTHAEPPTMESNPDNGCGSLVDARFDTHRTPVTKTGPDMHVVLDTETGLASSPPQGAGLARFREAVNRVSDLTGNQILMYSFTSE